MAQKTKRDRRIWHKVGCETRKTQNFIHSQNKNSEMGFYFGTGRGGVLDLAGKSLKLNTIVAK